MSMDLWYEDEPCEPRYLQISHQALGQFCKKTGKDFDAFRDKIHDHHSQPVTKDGMFILERFFSGDVLELVAEYLMSKGYTLVEDYTNLEGDSMVVGYDGVLMNWWW